MKIEDLDQSIKAVCPISGVSIGDLADKKTWRIDFLEIASDENKKNAADVIDSCPLPLHL